MRAYILCLALLGASTSAVAQQTKTPATGLVHVVIETDRGNISVALDSAHAPVSVTNFLRYVDGGAYTNGRFHRAVTTANQPNDSVKIEVIQGGANPMRDPSLRYPPIELERTSITGLRHKDGTLSMARSANPNSASSDFFICVGDQPSLDFGGHRNLDGQGFAAFGQVTAGMEVVRLIQSGPVNAQTLNPPVTIRRITRVK
jgi:peptidyl-prolyl cis-trans isomerase A (cyclophilin A)